MQDARAPRSRYIVSIFICRASKKPCFLTSKRTAPMQALRAAFSTMPMRALWDDEAIVASMLRFEAELAQAQAECELIPASAAQAIVAQCETVHLDVAALVEQARRAGTPAIPLVKALKAQLSHAAPDAAPY